MKVSVYTRFVLCFLLFASSAWGQQKKTAASPKTPIDTSLLGKYRVGVMTKSFGDSIVVRWAPNQSSFFRQALKSGYLLTRRSVIDNKTTKLDFQEMILPWTLDEWLKNTARRDTLAAACAQLVHGKNTPIGATEAVTLDKILEQQNQNDLRMMLALVLADSHPRYARGMALGWVDKKVKKGVQYLYYIIPLTDPQTYPVEVAASSVVNDGPGAPLKMVPVRPESGEHLIKLKWNRRLAESAFSSYHVERSTDGGKTFRRLTKRPWIQPPADQMDDIIQYADSVPQNYRHYHYRILGITPFGELAPSEVIVGMGVDKTPPPSVEQLNAKHLNGAKVSVTWKYPTVTGDVAGFVVAKATNLEGPFSPLVTQPLAPSIREFTDTTAIPHLPNYYKVIAIDTARNLGHSLPVYCIIKDGKGPSKPKGLQGYIDSTGFVRVVWDMNPEPDLMGYQVVSANDRKHVFTVDTKGYLALPVYNDSVTLNTLTRKKYFRVIAYDKNYNPSEASDILELIRPDKIAPTTPVIRDYVVSDTSVAFSWAPSSSDDVAYQLLLRRGKNSERWVELAKLAKDISTYTDKTIKGSAEYGYALVAVDEAGLRSETSFPLNVQTPRITPQKVNGLKAIVNPDKTVLVSWNYAVPNCRFVVYRSVEKEPFLSYDSVYDNRQYQDKRPPAKGIVQYAVRVIYPDGLESSLSSVVKVELK
ncbi:fibronectin type III domain-containing protein [Runella limosa]|uniref:fibronectin type III domain-containing protein n=1 Tax=Runella limosa TaxID=370978 RepID=UPI000415DF49|nr:fibronectin type III domain-containing protein [Runella limosa]